MLKSPIDGFMKPTLYILKFPRILKYLKKLLSQNFISLTKT